MTCDYLKTLNLVRDGHLDESHKAVQPYSDELSCLIHAYLHRVEGDQGNANYWYGRAGQTMPSNSLADEMNRLYRLVKAEKAAE